MARSLLKMFNWTFRLMCVIGAVIHVSVITVQYLKYETSNNVIMDIPKKFKPPDLSVCFRYADIIDDFRYESDTKRKLPKPNFANYREAFERIDRISTTLTLGDVLKYTPSAIDAIVKARIRLPNQLPLFSIDGANLGQYYKIVQFHVFRHICYKIIDITNHLYLVRTIASSQDSPGTLYRLYFNLSLFDNGRHLIIMTSIDTVQNALPHAMVLQRSSGYDDSRNNHNYSLFSYDRIDNTLLPPPFTTNCMNYPPIYHYNSLYCESDCVNKLTYDRLGLASFSQALAAGDIEYLDSKVLQVHQLAENRTMAAIYNRIGRECAKKCRQPSCRTQIFVTRFIERGEAQFVNTFEVELKMATSPDMKIVNQPAIEFSTFLIYVLSCFGIWLGLSISNFNPIDIISAIMTRHDSMTVETRTNQNLSLKIAQTKRRLRLISSENQEMKLTMSKMNHEIQFLKQQRIVA